MARIAKPLFHAALTLLVLGLMAVVGAAVIVLGGVYDVAAIHQHTLPVYSTLNLALQRSVGVRAARVEPPPVVTPEQSERGFRIYRDNCVHCHGAPGVARHDIGKGMLPVPDNLAQVGREKSAEYVYWVVENGIKMSGMPAWQFRLSEREMWAVTAFVKRLPELSPKDYAQLEQQFGEGIVAGAHVHAHAGGRTETEAAARPDEGLSSTSVGETGSWTTAGVDPIRGRIALLQYACTSCHEIPGVVGANGTVGPPLDRWARRGYIAGGLANTPDNLILWLRYPQDLAPGTAMPNLGVTERDAQDMAAYLYSLE